MDTLILIGNTFNANGELNFAAAAIAAIFSYTAFMSGSIRFAWIQMSICLIEVMIGVLVAIY